LDVDLKIKIEEEEEEEHKLTSLYSDDFNLSDVIDIYHFCLPRKKQLQLERREKNK